MHSTAWRNAVRRSMLVIGLAGGFTILGAGIAASTATADEQAPVVGGATAGTAAADDEHDQTSGEDGVGSGNQVEADADAPVDASDNQVTVIGDRNQHEGGGSEPRNGAAPDADADHTSGEDGVLSGNQAEAEVEAPVQLTGNQVTVIGDDNTSGGTTSPSCQDEDSSAGDTTNGDDGVLSGNQVDVDVDAPVDASGNQVTVIGDENTSGGSDAGGCSAPSGSGGDAGPGAGADAGSGGSGDTTSGEDGVGSGNQLTLAPAGPVDVSGNQVTVVGDGNQSGGSTSEGGSGAEEGSGSGDGDTTAGEGGTGSGNQLTLDPATGVDADENQLTVVGNDNENGSPEEGDDGTEGSGSPDDGDDGTDGSGGPDADRGDDRDQVRGGGFGGPGSPGTAVVGPLPVDAGPITDVLPQTGATSGLGAGLLGLVMLLGGMALTTRRRGVVRS